MQYWFLRPSTYLFAIPQPGELQLYEKLSPTPDWNVRVNAMIECDARNTFCPDAVKKIKTNNGKLHVRSVKLFGGMSLSFSCLQ
jgi:hypothetical protein